MGLKTGDLDRQGQIGLETKGQFTHRRQDTTACDTTHFFASHTIRWISSHTYAARPSLVVTTKSCCNKTIFVLCCSDSIKKTVSIGISPGFINV